MKFICFRLLPLLLISFKMFAQNDLVSGYIVKNNGDTLHGLLQQQPEKRLLHEMKFKTKATGDFGIFPANALKSFKYEGGDRYRSISFMNKAGDSAFQDTCFAKELVRGRYELYSFIKEGDTYFIVRKDTSVYLLYDEKFEDNELRKGNYLSLLSFFSIACDKLHKWVERTRYSAKDISAFIRDLDICIAPSETVSNDYHKPTHQINVVVFAGGLPLDDKQSQVTADAMIRFIDPHFDPKFSVNIGVHYSRTFNKTTQQGYFSPLQILTRHEIFSLPLTLQYNFTSGIIQPYAYVGFSAAYLSESPSNPSDNRRIGVAIVGGIGIDAHITHRLTARVDWRYELLYQFPAIGLAYAF